jgi:enoyl-CoA hydratase/carnithine racemase
MDLMISGDRISAETAPRYGLLNQVVPSGELLETALERARG